MGTDSVVSAAAAAATTTTTVTVTSTVSTGSHQFKINGYTYTHGQPIKSRRFQAGGHTWRILFYPNVDNAASFELDLSDRGKHWPDHVIARFTLFRHDDSEPVSFIHNFDPLDFAAAKKLMVMGRKALYKYVDKRDDSLTVQCDVSVIRVSVVKERPPARPSRIKTAWSGLTRRLRAHHVLGFRCLSAQPLLS
jgi:hypothetical protein